MSIKLITLFFICVIFVHICNGFANVDTTFQTRPTNRFSYEAFVNASVRSLSQTQDPSPGKPLCEHLACFTVESSLPPQSCTKLQALPATRRQACEPSQNRSYYTTIVSPVQSYRSFVSPAVEEDAAPHAFLQQLNPTVSWKLRHKIQSDNWTTGRLERFTRNVLCNLYRPS